MKKLLFYATCVCCIISFSAFIKTEDPITAILKKLEEFSKKYPQEKVYLHLDKPYYAVGDDIWFKAYVVDAKTAMPTTISKILYVELVNEKDSVTKLLKLQMQSGLANGDFKLGDELTEGNYRIRAYTQWMRNAGPNFFFDKTIKIGNYWANKVFTKANYVSNGNSTKASILFNDNNGKPYISSEVTYEIVLNGKGSIKGKITTNGNGTIDIPIQNSPGANGGKLLLTIKMPNGEKIVKIIPIKTQQQAIDVQFLPEGGNLIEGLPCKIAVKATNTSGFGQNVSGKVLDNNGAEILDFETTYLGMGFFGLTPEAGKTYTAKIKMADGAEKSFVLPVAQKSGYQLAVNNIDSTKVTVKVLISADLLNQGELNVVGQHNGNVYFSTKVNTTKQVSTLVVPKNEFPSGIVQLTLFANNLPVTERIIFVHNLSSQIDLSLSNLKSAYAKKEKVDLKINASNNSKSTQGSFSIAITNADIIAPDLDNESNILTGLLLNADVVGYVEKPNHYFLNNTLETRTQLDNLMLTQGWRKIDWNEVANSTLTTPEFAAEKGMSISGTVTGKGKKPVANGKITLLSSTKGNFVATTETDEKGHFSFDDSIFGDSLRFVIQASTKEDKKDVNVQLDKVPNQTVTVNKNNGDVEVNVNNSIITYLKESNDYFEDQFKKGFLNRTNQLKTVTITQKRITKEDSAAVNSANLNGRGRANAIVTSRDLINATSVAQYFAQGRVMGVAISKEEDTYNQPLLTKYRPEDLLNPKAQPIMAVALDGFVLRDFSLDNIDVADVESIEVLTDVSYSAIYGVDGYFGVIVITTKQGKGKKMSEIYAPGLVTFMPKGYDTPRKFYSPTYEVKAEEKADLRTTIYWNPDVVTDSSGSATLNYYNANQPGSYRIVIEGIDADGNLARKIQTYEVK